jgi:hypothetical protein
MGSVAENPANMQLPQDGTSSPDSGIASSLKWVPLPAPLSTSQPGTITITVDSENSYPCRRCLTDGQINESMLLLSYDPFLGDSPYSGPGPIFVHQEHCTPYQGTKVPEQQRRRLLSVRAYDGRHMMVGSEVLQGSELEEVAGRMLDGTGVEYLHVHNAKPGCFAVRVERG